MNHTFYFFHFFFFFQAEDGIRDADVTRVQTCALPIFHLETSSVLIRQLPLDQLVPGLFGERCPTVGEAPRNELVPVAGAIVQLGKPRDYPLYGWDRSEERRVGKEWRSRWSLYQCEK